MIKLMYSPWLAAYLLLLQMVLMLTVGMYRIKKLKGMGVQDDLTLERLVRRHGNLAENAGIFVAAIALLELQTGSTPLVFGLCLVFAIAEPCTPLGSPLLLEHISLIARGLAVSFLGARAIGALSTAFSGIVCGFALAIALST